MNCITEIKSIIYTITEYSIMNTELTIGELLRKDIFENTILILILHT
jgi:hypothetical protein